MGGRVELVLDSVAGEFPIVEFLFRDRSLLLPGVSLYLVV